MRSPSLVVALVCLTFSSALGERAFAQALQINDRTVPEGNTGSADVTLTVTLTAAASGIVRVDYEAENLATPTATGGAACGGTTDYIIETGTLQFEVGQVSQSVGIGVCGDAVVESNEAFRVRLRNASGATIEDQTGRVTITNDDAAAAPPPAISINDLTAAEGNTGTTSRQFNVTLSAASSQAVTVQFAFAATPANPATRGTACAAGIDVALPASGSLTFAPAVTTQTIPLAVCGDVLDESDETFDVVLSNPAGATLADGTGRGTITDDDLPPPLPSLTVSNVTVVEGNTGTTPMIFTVTLSAVPSQVVTVPFVTTATGPTVQGATCAATVDLLLSQGTLTFSAGVRTQQVAVTVCRDVLDEADETFDVVLSNPTGATIADGTGRGTITDDDLATALPSLSVSNATKVEGTTGTTQTQHMQFTVTLSAASSQPVGVSLASTSTGSALHGATCVPTVDLQQLQASITFPPGVQSLPFGVTLCGDALDEPDETFDIVLSNPTGATIADGTGRGTITDDDLPGPATDLTVNVAKAGALPTVATGTNVAFDFTVANVGSTSVTNVVTRASIPFAFTALAPSAAAGTGIICDGVGRVVGSTEPHLFRCTAASVAFNSQKGFRIAATAPATITGSSQSFTVTAQVDPDATISEGSTGEGNNSDNFTLSVVTMADLVVDLPNAPGQALTTQVAPDLVYLADVHNKGDRAAPNLLVRFTLPKDVGFVRVEENTLGSCLQNSTASDGALNVNCTLSSLPADAKRGVRILGRTLGSVPDGVQVTFAANVDPNNSVPERNDTDNTAFLTTTLRAPSDVQISGNATSFATSPGGIFDPGDSFALQLQLTVKNNGPFASPPTIVRTGWPAQFSAPREGCFATCNVPAIAPGQSVQISMTGAHNFKAGQVQITATVDPDQKIFDPVLGNNAVTFSGDVHSPQ